MRLLPTSNKRLNLLVLLKAFGLGPAALTSSGKTDGGGAQVHAVLSVQAFCRTFGFPYAHTPFRQIEHSAGPAEVARWEQAFRLGDGFPSADADAPTLKAYARKPWLWGRKILVALPHAHDFADSQHGAYAGLSKRRPPQADGRAIVAIHVRRGDVSPAQNASRYTTDAEIADRIRLLQRHLPDAECRIYSEGIASDFQLFADLGCRLRLGGDPLDILQEMAAADVLVTAKSSFSYVAALFNPNLVLYTPFWHAMQPGWVCLEDEPAVIAALQARRR